MAASPEATPQRFVSLAPIGCDQCGSTSLKSVGGQKFQCAYCGAFMLEREPPPLPEPPPGADPSRPPPSQVHQMSAIEVLALDAQGLVAAPPVEEIGKALDRHGPKGFFRPKPLSKFVQVTEAKGHAPIRLQYQVFLETRRYDEVLHPYRGQVPDTSQLPPLWSTSLQPAREVTTRRVPLAGQQSVTVCPRCTGAGWITCDPCDGNGRTDCTFCQGGVDVSQVLLNGKWASERQTCVHCQGKGWNSCSACGGDGRVTCDTCQGQTRVLRGWERVEDFTLPTMTHAVSDGRDWSSHVWMGRAEGQLIFDRDVPGRLDLTETDGPIAKLADQVVLEHNHSLEAGYPYWSRFVVTRIPVVEVSYKIRSTPGTLHIYGRDQRVSMRGKKPIGCMGCLFWALGAIGAVAGLATVTLFSSFL